MHLFVSIHTAPKGGDNAGESQADTTGAETAHERANSLANAPPQEHKANTGGNESGEDTNNGANANLTRHRRNDGSPIRSGHDLRGRIRQGDKLHNGRNGQNIKRSHKKHLT